MLEKVDAGVYVTVSVAPSCPPPDYK